MRPHYFIAAFGIFVIGTMISAIASGRWLVNVEMNIINAITSMNAASVQAGDSWDIPKALGGVGGFLDGVVTVLSWRYPFLETPWAIFIKIPLWACSLGVLLGLYQLFMSAIQGVLGALRGTL